MALTHVGCEVRVRLPRWDHHLVERLELAGIDALDAPGRVHVTPLEVSLLVPAETAADARAAVMRAVRGWTVLLSSDFG